MGMAKQSIELAPKMERFDWNEQQFLMFDLDEMANVAEATNDDVIRLTLGKSELPPNDLVVRAMQEAMTDFEKSTLVFPAGLPQLRARLAHEYQRRYAMRVEPERVIVNVGTSGLFRNLFYLLGRENGEVLLPRPYYPLYVFCARLAGLRVKYYDIDPSTMKIDLHSVSSSLSEDTVAVVINSPGNPMGNVITLEELRTLDLMIAGRACIISDEIYSNVYFDERPFSIAQLDEPISPIVITNGFSKAHRMYARRVGFAIVPERFVDPLTVIQQHTLLTTDPVPQFGALAAIELEEDVQKLVRMYGTRRDYTLERFNEVADVDALPSRGGFYLTLDWTPFKPRFGSDNSHQLARRIFDQTHVATVPGSDFGLKTALRLSFTSSKYNEGIDRLVDFFSCHAC
jgi:aspartate/methionine/tyrosine aminotransferase